MNYRKIIAASLALALGASLWPVPQPVRAADVTLAVDTTLDSNEAAYQVCSDAPNDCSLRGAISKANADATNAYTIQLQPAQVYPLTLAGAGEFYNASGDLNLRAGMVIEGQGARIESQVADRVLRTTGTQIQITLRDLTLSGGRAPDASQPGYSGEPGGGIYIQSSGTLTLVNCVIRDNAAGNGLPGASGAPAGAAAATSGGNGSSGGYGGGITNGALGTLVLDGVIVENNRAGNGAAGGPGGDGNAQFSAASGGNGGSGGLAGGIYTSSENTVLINTTVRNNRAGEGGPGGGGGRGGDNPAGAGTAGGAGGNGGATGGYAGGIYTRGLIVQQSVIHHNLAGNSGMGGAGGSGGDGGNGAGGRGGNGGDAGTAGGGGGVYNSSNMSSANNQITNATFYGNEAGRWAPGGPGGAGGSGTSGAGANGTAGTNSLDGGGGAYYNSGSNPLYLNFVTISSNRARQGAGIKNHGTIYARNSILAGNRLFSGATGGDVWMANVSTPYYSDGYNLYSSGVSNTQPSDLTITDTALLGLLPLADNGGPTWTVGLGDSSPAVNSASCTDRNGLEVTVDQRGAARPVSELCDRGAFEFIPAPPPVQFLPLVRQ